MKNKNKAQKELLYSNQLNFTLSYAALSIHSVKSKHINNQLQTLKTKQNYSNTNYDHLKSKLIK